jgi:hypothetical protein
LNTLTDTPEHVYLDLIEVIFEAFLSNYDSRHVVPKDFTPIQLKVKRLFEMRFEYKHTDIYEIENVIWQRHHFNKLPSLSYVSEFPHVWQIDISFYVSRIKWVEFTTFYISYEVHLVI